ncbi:MAG: hypothetical protein V4632_16650 [Pseudomonadota bacterium]
MRDYRESPSQGKRQDLVPFGVTYRYSPSESDIFCAWLAALMVLILRPVSAMTVFF